ncbi:corticotropin-releasing factor-binding protein isoform X1 [Clupea harengus]|uniref:Corticotropin-releasing factor-binding protein n=1 Tax=Clupea harengus TaxID=7950 RepID=A0A6P3VXP5_CLUHA|nr:corticotropin-releasing factor-binding protein isoform X1 [Clupea harengus]
MAAKMFIVLLLFYAVFNGLDTHMQQNEVTFDQLLSRTLVNKREPWDFVYGRSLRCFDMVATEGQFTFTSDHAQLNCGVFFIGEPNEVISIELSMVDIDCSHGDIIKMFDGWILNGNMFPNSLDHSLPLSERYADYCTSGMAKGLFQSSQNVAMMLFRVHTARKGFSVTLKKHINPFPCNIISQTPVGSFTMVIPHQRRNCSFSIIYPVEIQITKLSLDQSQSNDVALEKPGSDCADSDDFVVILGGNVIDTSKMLPVTDLCFFPDSQTQMKIGCDNTAVRMVASGKYINSVSFHYRLLEHNELLKVKQNTVEDFCSLK